MQHNQFMPELYPREYRESASSRFGKIFLGAILALIGSATVIAVSSGFMHGTAHFKLFAVLFSVFLFIALFGIYLIIKAIRLRIILTDSELIVQKAFNTEFIQRMHIKSFYHSTSSTVIKVYPNEYQNNREQVKFQITGLNIDADYSHWFNGLGKLDEEIEEESLQYLLEDTRLGKTIEERINNIRRAHKIFNGLTLCLLTLFIYLIVYTSLHHFITYNAVAKDIAIYCYLVLLATPFLILVTYCILNQYFYLFEYRYHAKKYQNEPHKVDLTVLMLCLLIPLYLYREPFSSLINWTSFVLFNVILAFSVLIILFLIVKTKHFLIGSWLCRFIFLVVYFSSVFLLINKLMDNALPNYFEVTITGNQFHPGRVKFPSTPNKYSPIVSAWGPYTSTNSLNQYSVTPYTLKSKLCIQLHSGFLGFDWYSVHHQRVCPPN